MCSSCIRLQNIFLCETPPAFFPGDTPTRNVRSFGVFWVRREWSGEAEGRSERGRGRAREREGESGGEREGGRRTTGERREWAINHAEEVSLISGLAAASLPLSPSPSVCLHRPTDRDRPRSENAAFAATQRRTTEKEKRRERNVGRTDGRSDRRSGGRRAARRSGGKSARMHFLPLHSPFS